VVEVLHLPHPKLLGLLRGGEHLSAQPDSRRGQPPDTFNRETSTARPFSLLHGGGMTNDIGARHARRARRWGQRNEIHLRSPTRPARPPARPQVAVLDTRAGAGKTARYTARCQYTRARSPLPRPPPRARTSAALSATRHATTDQELSTLSRGALFVRCFLSE
jgi:hypothetical protein